MKPGDIVTGASGTEYVIGDPLGDWPEMPSGCDAHQWGGCPSMYPDGRCRCLVCARCGHHTGNSTQGHYWKFCKVTGTMREFHMCCPDPAHGCELDVALAVGRAQDEVNRLRQTYEGLLDGTLHWSYWRDDLTCPERTQVAIEECYSALCLAEEGLAQLTQAGGNR